MIKINTFKNLLDKCEKENKDIFEVSIEKESELLEITETEVRQKVSNVLSAMKSSIQKGLMSQELSTGKMSGFNCKKLKEGYKDKQSLFGNLFETITTYALAVIEENSRMGRIAACPTAGSCGIVPSVLIAYSEEYKISEKKQIEALITAGFIGEIISAKTELAGASGGCQAECGTASAMAAGALVYLAGGTPEQSVHAAVLAIKNILGLTCDPVKGLVEVPCVKRNVFLSIHAVTAAELALRGIQSFIPPDEVLDAMAQTGQLMSPLLKESALGGLAQTKTALSMKTSEQSC